MNNKIKAFFFSSIFIFQLAHAGNVNLFDLLSSEKFHSIKTEIERSPRRISEVDIDVGDSLLHALAREPENTRTIELATWLIEHGADTTERNHDGRRPYDLAVEAGNWQLANILQDQNTAPHFDFDATQPLPLNVGGHNFFNMGRPGFPGHPGSFGDVATVDIGGSLMPITWLENMAAEVLSSLKGSAKDNVVVQNEKETTSGAMSRGTDEEHGKPGQASRKRKRAEEREEPQYVEVEVEADSEFDDELFSLKKSNRSSNAFGNSYKKARNAPRNPNPPPTGFQKRKSQLTYSNGPKSSLAPPSESKQERRKRARKE